MTWLDSAIDSLSGQPRWLLIACGAVLAAGLLWLVTKLLKWSLYVLVFIVLVAGGGAALVWWLG